MKPCTTEPFPGPIFHEAPARDALRRTLRRALGPAEVERLHLPDMLAPPDDTARRRAEFAALETEIRTNSLAALARALAARNAGRGKGRK